jgi:hypothetical protein
MPTLEELQIIATQFPGSDDSTIEQKYEHLTQVLKQIVLGDVIIVEDD